MPNRRFLLAMLATALSGCSLLPPAPQPAPKEIHSVAMRQTLADAQAAGVVMDAPLPSSDWWRAYQDAGLNAAIARALDGNPTLQQTAARLAAARAAVDQNRADDTFHMQLNADVNTQRFPEHGLFPPPFAGNRFNQSDLNASFAKDFDLWGKVAAQTHAADLRARAARDNQENARLVLALAVARRWFALAGTQQQLTLRDAEIHNLQARLQLEQQRLKAGLASAVSVTQIEQALQAAQVTRTELVRSQRDDRFELAALEGLGPDQVANMPMPAQLPAPARIGIPAKVPLDLVSRRADVAARLLLAQAAGADIQAARARFYPDIEISGSAGLQAMPARFLLEPGSLIYMFGPALHLPLFDGGKRTADLKAREAQRDEAVALYNRTVLDAARDVAVALDSVVQSRSAQTGQSAVVQTVQRRQQLTAQQFHAGLADRRALLTAQADLLAARAGLEYQQENELTAQLGLIRALGGGFDAGTGQATRKKAGE